jgi:antitoxin PrlF
MKAVVAERGQVTIPKRLRERLGIRPKTVLEFREKDGCLIATKETPGDPVEQVMGCLKLSKDTDELMIEFRGAR